MSIIDKLFGHQEEPQRPAAPAQPAAPPPMSADEQALARYRYMLQTAPPETIEQAHAEAFAKLTPEQRRMVLQQLSANAPEHERAAATDDPQSLARMATRAEVRQPGTMERLFGGAAAPGMGGAMGGGLGGMMGGILPSLAAGFVGSMIAQHFFNNTSMGQGFFGGGMGQGFMGGGQDNLHATPDAGNKDDDSDDQSDKDDSDDSDDQDDSADSQDEGDTGPDSADSDFDSGDSGGDDQFA